MTDESLRAFDLPAVRRNKVTVDLEGGLISSDVGLVPLREAERRLRLADSLAGCMRDRRVLATVVHTLPAMLRFRMFAIASGYEDVDNCDALRTDPLFKLAVGRVLCSQSTMSQLENTPSRIEVARMMAAQSARLKNTTMERLAAKLFVIASRPNPTYGGTKADTARLDVD